MLVKAGGGLAGGVILLLTVYSFQVFETGAQGVGLLQFARGIGILVGPFIVARFVGGRIGRAQHFISIGFFVVGVSYILFGLAPTIFIAMLCVCVAHMGWGSNWTISAALLQRLTPDYIRGRIFSMDLGMLTLTLAFSTFVTGMATDRFNPHVVAYALGATFVIFGIVWTLGVWLSQHRVPDQWQDGPLSAPELRENTEDVLLGAE
jgi:sugar phosphate permease